MGKWEHIPFIFYGKMDHIYIYISLIFPLTLPINTSQFIGDVPIAMFDYQRVTKYLLVITLNTLNR